MSIGEIPMLMILEYFYIERVGGSDGFWQNPLVAANNLLTILAMIGLLISACNLMYDNTRNEMEKPCFVKGIGTVDGKLDLFELYSRFHFYYILSSKMKKTGVKNHSSLG